MALKPVRTGAQRPCGTWDRAVTILCFGRADYRSFLLGARSSSRNSTNSSFPTARYRLMAPTIESISLSDSRLMPFFILSNPIYYISTIPY